MLTERVEADHFAQRFSPSLRGSPVGQVPILRHPYLQPGPERTPFPAMVAEDPPNTHPSGHGQTRTRHQFRPGLPESPASWVLKVSPSLVYESRFSALCAHSLCLPTAARVGSPDSPLLNSE